MEIVDCDEALSFSTYETDIPFSFCPLETIYIGRNINFSESYSPFYGVETLSSLTIGKNVSFIDDTTFSGCNGLTSIIVDKNNPVYDSRDNCNAIIETASNTLIFRCSTTVVPHDVTSIGRTVMVYMVAENSLNRNITADIKEMLTGMNNNILHTTDRLVIYLDDVLLPRIYVLDQTTKATSLSELNPVMTYDEDVNSSSATQLVAFIDYTKTHYPADSYGLVMWSHATGWLPSTYSGDKTSDAPSRRKSFGVDNGRNANDNIGHQMNIDDMAAALEGEDFDFMFFDASLMQNIEVAYELRHATKYLIASPAEIPSPGANYETLVKAMFRKDDYVNKIMEAYYREYLEGPYGVVISAVNTSALDDFAAYMQPIVHAHQSEMLALNTSSLQNYLWYGGWTTGYPDFLDMQGIMHEVLSEGEYANWKVEADKVFSCMHTAKWYSAYPRKRIDIDDAQCCGVSMFIPFEKYASTSFNTDYYTTSWAKAVWQ